MEHLDELNPDSNTTIKPPSPFQYAFESMTKDMRFVGMFTIIYGTINCLTIIGAIIGVPMIFIGIRIREAADQFLIFKTTNNAAALRLGFESQGKYFRIVKILIIIQLVLIVLSIIAVILFMSFFLSSLMQYSTSS
ncbi:MAG: DUF5362 domain-containing protein [Ignavibacteriales bacterium]|nr:DUF5362 domain-containing protein [Ignavibacteriales bacterium]